MSAKWKTEYAYHVRPVYIGPEMRSYCCKSRVDLLACPAGRNRGVETSKKADSPLSGEGSAVGEPGSRDLCHRPVVLSFQPLQEDRFRPCPRASAEKIGEVAGEAAS
jgi:hypothetical protein